MALADFKDIIRVKIVVETDANRQAFALDFLVFLSLWFLTWAIVGLSDSGGTS